ncbi:COG4705 family protein [Actinoplanes sp. HUAS TT8]|uniref:COG4705 family protein n=1 Tax=Actinoplanes sp. HUAS TT8 TaxID=3447453 RepID=UPI003F51FEA2
MTAQILRPALSTPSGAAGPVKAVMKKLPEITLAFWVMKIAATTLGETAGDMISQTLKLGYFLSTVTLFAIFVVTLVVQLRSRRYNPVFYWTVILSTSMAGTTLSDFMNRDASAHYLAKGATSLGWGPQGLGLGYPTGAAILTSLLVIVFIAWKGTGLPFDINKINTFRGEALFWTAILISNTLGTSMGDFLSDSSGLGYLGGAVLITGVLAVLAVCTKIRWIPNVLVFWLAFVLTRPLGATVGDFFTKPAVKGGLGLGTYGASAVLLAVLAGFMIWSTVRERRNQLTHA